jgi:hypothetical protein
MVLEIWNLEELSFGYWFLVSGYWLLVSASDFWFLASIFQPQVSSF